jgi:hypothetical protein
MIAVGLYAPRSFGQDSAFTYQGQLRRAGNPANGNFDMQFRLWNADGIEGIGAPVSTAITRTVAVSNGLFSTSLDFGSTPFTGALLWMEMGVRTNGTGAFTPLAPRQPVTATPYAVRAAFYGGPISDAQLPETVARLDQPWQSTNTVSLSHPSNTLAGTFTGTGTFIGGASVGAAGTALKQVLHGTALVGDSTGGVKTVSIPFPTAFTAPPRVVAMARGATSTEVFGLTTRSISLTQFEVNVLRLDAPGAAWNGLQLDWMAWE